MGGKAPIPLVVLVVIIHNLSSALAAHGRLLCLRVSLDGMHHLHERGHHSGDLRGLLYESIGSTNGSSKIGLVSAIAATSLVTSLTGSGITSGSLAYELTLGLRAGDGLLALPVTLSSLTHRSTDSIGSLTLSSAVSRRADSLTLRAVLLLTEILRAANIALGLVTVNLALGTLSLFTVDLTLGSLTDGMADCRADWVITLPSALRMAVTLDFCHSIHEVSLSCYERDSEESKEED